jgi:hypothetical protein
MRPTAPPQLQPHSRAPHPTNQLGNIVKRGARVLHYDAVHPQQVVVHVNGGVTESSGGAGGDFIKMICCRQMYADFNFELTSSGMIHYETTYFKNTSEKFFKNNQHFGEFDYSLVHKVDNSHYYLDSYPTIANQLFFINYPESAAEFIVDIYKEKRRNNNITEFFNHHHTFLPDNIKKYATEENIIQIISKLWIKQLKIWQSNTALTPIQLTDFFNKEKLKVICETIMDCPVQNQEMFDLDATMWLDKNQKLAKFLN